MMLSLLVPTLLGSLSVRAAPLEPRQGITTLSTAQVNAFTPYTHFASTAYCHPSTTYTWTCGGNAFQA